MKWKLSKKQITWGLTALGVLILTIIFYSLFYRAQSIGRALKGLFSSVTIVTYGVIIAYILSPVLNFIEKRILIPICKKCGITLDPSLKLHRMRTLRRVSVILTMIFFLLLLFILIMLLVPQLIYSITEIARNFPRYVNNVYRYANKYLSEQPEMRDFVIRVTNQYSDRINDFFNDTLLPTIQTLSTTLLQRFFDVLQGFFNFFIGIIVAVYLLFSKEKMSARAKKMAYAFFRADWANEIVGAFRYIHYTFIGFITGKILDSVIIGILCYIAMMAFRLPYPVLVSFFVGVTNILLFFGPYIGGAAGVILLILIDPIAAAAFLAIVVVLQTLDGNVIGPMILGNSTGLSGFWVIFSIMLFGGLFGMVGWFVGVPVFAVFYAFMRRLTDHLLTRRGLTTDTEIFEDLAYVEKGKVRLLSDKKNTRFYARRPRSNWKRLLHIKDRNEETPAGDGTPAEPAQGQGGKGAAEATRKTPAGSGKEEAARKTSAGNGKTE